MNVLGSQLLALAGLGSVGKSDFHVDVVSGLIKIGSVVLTRIHRSLSRRLRGRFALVDPFFTGISGTTMDRTCNAVVHV